MGFIKVTVGAAHQARGASRRYRSPRQPADGLAIRFDHLVRSGAVADQAGLARLGHVTRARVTQIMNLLLLAPDIQEEILFLPAAAIGHNPVHERSIRFITAVPDWRKQRRLWQERGASPSTITSLADICNNLRDRMEPDRMDVTL